MNKYKFLESKINFLFKKLYDIKNHPFYLDLNKVNSKSNFINKNNISYKKVINDIPNENIYFEENIKEFDISILKSLSIEMTKINNFDKILKIINLLTDMHIPSNVINKDKLLLYMNQSKQINILILGAGPIGLFLACYLFNYYNTSYGLNNYPNVNIIVFDNRVDMKNKRKPYTRNRPFFFNSSFLSQIIPKIYAWDTTEKDGLFININILEYVLFTKAYYEYMIPFIFEDINWDEIQKIISLGKIDVLFDCTGGRLNPPIFKNIDTSWIDILINKFNKMNVNDEMPDINVIKDKNLVILENNNDKFLKHYYYCSIIILKKKNNNLTNKGNRISINISNYEDNSLIKKHKDKYFNYDNMMLIVKGINDDMIRNYLYSKIKYYDDNYLFKIEYFNTYLRHQIEIAKVIETDNNKCLYIGAGDTIFHSHFITGSGLNRTINFAVKCANFLIYLRLID